jgi:putative membrane protein
MNLAVSYLNEAFIISSAIVMAFGWMKIRQGKKQVHRRLMLTATILASLFFISYVLKTVIIGDTMFGGPKGIQPAYQVFLQAHSILATVAAIMGIVTLRYALKEIFGKHKKIARWTVITWFVTAATGLVVFILLYVVYPMGPTTNVFRAWIG